jgi:tetratricopeptide (TPR) repeat protein
MQIQVEVTRAVVVRCMRLLRFDANNADVWHTLGTALAALGDRGGALTALRNAVMLDESRAHTHLALGKLLFDTGRLDDALRCFDCAAARDPAIVRGGS